MTTPRRTAVAVSGLALVGFAFLVCLMLAGVAGCPLLPTEQASSVEHACLRNLQPIEEGGVFSPEVVSEVCSAIGDTLPPAALLEFGGRGCAFSLDCATEIRDPPETLASNPSRLIACWVATQGGFCSFLRPISLEAVPLAVAVFGRVVDSRV